MEGSLCVSYSSRTLGHMREQNRQNSKRNTYMAHLLCPPHNFEVDSAGLLRTVFFYTVATSYMFKLIKLN